jgi:hypothetical protein
MTTKQIGSETRAQRRRREQAEGAVSTSLSALMLSEKSKEFSVFFKGQEYIFSYKELPWGTHLEQVSKNWDGDVFNISGYYEDMLLETLLSFPDGSRPTRSVLRKFHPDIFYQLQEMVPKPSMGEAIENGKKGLKPPLEEEELDEIVNDSQE